MSDMIKWTTRRRQLTRYELSALSILEMTVPVEVKPRLLLRHLVRQVQDTDVARV